ncbi:tumor necrosis factor receptor superfamily member 1A [Fundulus heteroclitus]|uniref:tumor necrosis factor receptor superfamily member 1A n=1 Tax=Fundulus heteroclitus TaxID=8078 RepID=UPI00165BD9CD|nr:tumor necrosis factor receptor superfamily member 1A [Fundulus heteroclitus]
MEGIGKQGRCRFTLLLLMLMSVPVLTILQLEEQPCRSDEYKTEEGICCIRCHAGYKLVEKCHAVGQRSNCTECSKGEFSDQMNSSPTCRRCRKCKPKRNEYEFSECSGKQDTICRCKDGYYKDNIDSETYECKKCKTCGINENEVKPCTHERNTECECKENYYRVRDKCEPCTSCTAECAQYCSTPVQTKGPDHHHPPIINLIAGSVAVVFVVLALGISITYMATKSFIKRKLQRQSSYPPSPSNEDSKDFLVSIREDSGENGLRTAVEAPLGEQELSKLPDCVPMIPDLIYAVLDLVPVHQVKQLVRCLGVTDMEIEQAEMDHRFCREAHYQMLRVWAQRGSGAVGVGQGEMVRRPLLEELLDKLRQIHLSRAAEELETKYAIQ